MRWKTARSKSRLLAITGLMGIVLWAGAGQAKEGKVPVILSLVPYYHWIAETKTPLDQFTFLVNGIRMTGKTGAAEKYQNSLHVHFHLTRIKHTMIEIKEGEHTVFKADVFYAPSFVPNKFIPEAAVIQPFHTVDNERPCLGCHRLTVTPEDSSPADITKEVCYPCHHLDYEGKKYPHAPAALSWSCPQCHISEPVKQNYKDKHPLRFTIKVGSDAQPVCYDCHVALKRRNLGYAYIHGPVDMGACTICHNPHAADRPHLLQDDITTLCVNCHGLHAMMKKKVVHPIIKKAGCTACHDSHGSPNPKQLIKPLYELCISCHKKLAKRRNNHPVAGHPTYIKAAVAGAKDKINCVSCHNPHASDYPEMLPAGELMQVCTHCHPTKGR
ncbi:MAG: cytochrome c3 family protein [Desulfobacteraceae bacterium]|nr:cytochrome c3 family protein [Desulfobacteraceae bacterium]